MSASFSAETEIPLNQRDAFLHLLRKRLKALSPFRWIFLVIGFVSIGYGQHLIEQRYLQGEAIPQAKLWNDLYRLAIVNFDNVLYALPYLLGGAFLCALTVLPLAWKTPFKNWQPALYLREKLPGREQLRYILAGSVIFVFLIVQLARHQYHWAYLVLWLLSICAFTYVTWKWDRTAQKDLSPGIVALDLFWISALLILGFAINSMALQDIPAILIQDEGSFWENARAIAVNELHPAFFDSGVYSFPIASSLYQGWILKIFGLSLWAWRFSSVIAGVLTVIPLYLLGREWFNRHVAITAAVLMVANPYFISFARLGYNNSQSLFPVVLCIYFFALAAHKGSIFYLWLAGITAGFGFYTYSSAWLGIVTICLGLLYLLILRQIKWKEMLVSLGIILLAWGIMFAPRLAYTASGKNRDGLVYKIFETSFVNTFYAKAYYGEADLLQTTRLIHFSNRDTLFYDPVIYRELLFRGTVRSVLALFDPHLDSEHFLVTGFAGVISPIFFLAGLALSLRLWKQLHFGLPLIWLTAGLVFMSIIAAFPPRQTHFVSAIPVLALIAGIGLSAGVEILTESLLQRWPRVQSTLQAILLSGACITIAYFGIQKYFVTMPTTYPPLFEDIASWIAWKTRAPSDLIYLGQSDAPHRVQYLVNVKLVNHRYRALLLKDFSPEIISSSNDPTIIFIESQQGLDEMAKWSLPGFSVPIPYTYTDGSTIGYVMTNTAIDINPGLEWGEYIRSLVDTPVLWFFIPLMVVMIVSGFSAVTRRKTM